MEIKMSRLLTQGVAAEAGNGGDASVIDFMSLAQKNWPSLGVIHEQLEKLGVPGMRSYDEIRSMRKAAIETFVKSGIVLAGGAEELGRHGLSLWHVVFASGMEATRAIADVQTPQEWFQIQSAWTDRFMTVALDHIAILSGLSIRVSNQIAEPIHAHISDTLGKVGKRE
jgi:hypothetical protein